VLGHDGAAAGWCRTVSETGPALVEESRTRLLQEQAQLSRTVAVTGEELASRERENEPGDPLEDVPVQDVADTLSRLEGREWHRLDEVNAALGRLDGGTYGVCERCTRPIPLARLRAMPSARYCVECQASQERRRPELA
jgi:RNA polymerase-binding protein DksA